MVTTLTCWRSSRPSVNRGSARGGANRGRRGRLSARTIKRRLATIAGLYEYLIIRGDMGDTEPRPSWFGDAATWPAAGSRRPADPSTAHAAARHRPRRGRPFVAALRTPRDRAMVRGDAAGGLRRCEVLGLRLGDVRPGERRLFIAEGKGGHQRIVPVSPRFFTTLAAYLATSARTPRPTDHIFLVLKGPRRGQPLSHRRSGRDRRWRPGPGRHRASDLPPASPYLLHPAAGGGDGSGGDPGASWAPLDRVDPHLPAPCQRLAGR